MPGPQPLIARYGATAAMVLLTFALRLALQDRGGPYQFILFVPAVVARGFSLTAARDTSRCCLEHRADCAASAMAGRCRARIVAITICILIGSGLTLISEALIAWNAPVSKAERETQLLLQEMSHRVKNKFAMVVSMLHCKPVGLPSPETQAASKRSAPGCG